MRNPNKKIIALALNKEEAAIGIDQILTDQRVEEAESIELQDVALEKVVEQINQREEVSGKSVVAPTPIKPVFKTSTTRTSRKVISPTQTSPVSTKNSNKSQMIFVIIFALIVGVIWFIYNEEML